MFSFILIIIAAVLIVVVIRHTHGRDYTPKKPVVEDERLTLADAERLYEDGELVTRAGYLHYTLSEAYGTDGDDAEVFTGWVRPDAQHDGSLLVFDEDERLVGRIDGQHGYYAALLNRRRANCYGFIAKLDGGGYAGEVCVRNI